MEFRTAKVPFCLLLTAKTAESHGVRRQVKAHRPHAATQHSAEGRPVITPTKAVSAQQESIAIFPPPTAELSFSLANEFLQFSLVLVQIVALTILCRTQPLSLCLCDLSRRHFVITSRHRRHRFRAGLVLSQASSSPSFIVNC